MKQFLKLWTSWSDIIELYSVESFVSDLIICLFIICFAYPQCLLQRTQGSHRQRKAMNFAVNKHSMFNISSNMFSCGNATQVSFIQLKQNLHKTKLLMLKFKMMSSCNHPHIVQNLYGYVFPQNVCCGYKNDKSTIKPLMWSLILFLKPHLW